jgi:hypothetical protein
MNPYCPICGYAYADDNNTTHECPPGFTYEYTDGRWQLPGRVLGNEQGRDGGVAPADLGSSRKRAR